MVLGTWYLIDIIKYSMSKIKKIAVWLFLVLYMVIILGFVNTRNNKLLCKSIEINIKGFTGDYFIDKDDVLSFIYKENEKILGYPVKSINKARLETILMDNPSIKNTEIYVTLEGRLIIDVEQRIPVLRVINNRNESFYIDEEGVLMPLSEKHSAHVVVANGQIRESYTKRKEKNVLSLTEDAYVNENSILKDLYLLAVYINNNEFWNAQIEQIFVNRNNEFELVPRVGAHIIIFGEIDNYRDKFEKLSAMYEKGLRYSDWNKYSTINLKYKDQVVCTKN